MKIDFHIVRMLLKYKRGFVIEFKKLTTQDSMALSNEFTRLPMWVLDEVPKNE